MTVSGFLFFGTITHVEETIRTLVEGPAWERGPIRFLILNLSLVAGVDMSAAEAFVRLQRLLVAKRVTLVLCGVPVESPVENALASVGLLDMEGVEVFLTFNDALECKCLGRHICFPCCNNVDVLGRDGEHLLEGLVFFSEGGDRCRGYVARLSHCMNVH